MAEPVDLCSVIITCFISPLGMFMSRPKIDAHWLLNLVLYILTVTIVGTIHAFVVQGMNVSTAILNYLLPPLSVFLTNGNCAQTLICLLLTLLGWLPGMIYAYWVTSNGSKSENLV